MKNNKTILYLAGTIICVSLFAVDTFCLPQRIENIIIKQLECINNNYLYAVQRKCRKIKQSLDKRFDRNNFSTKLNDIDIYISKLCDENKNLSSEFGLEKSESKKFSGASASFHENELALVQLLRMLENIDISELRKIANSYNITLLKNFIDVVDKLIYLIKSLIHQFNIEVSSLKNKESTATKEQESRFFAPSISSTPRTRRRFPDDSRQSRNTSLVKCRTLEELVERIKIIHNIAAGDKNYDIVNKMLPIKMKIIELKQKKTLLERLRLVDDIVDEYNDAAIKVELPIISEDSRRDIKADISEQTSRKIKQGISEI
ncbi:MAG: hypothetical protein LBS23_00175 [Holosporaceae bacterium]|nr:hypothetical protein [Holosporaceae bacterium]